MTDERFVVRSRPEESRYVLLDLAVADPAEQVVGEESYVDVETADGVQRVLYHTGVSDDYSGRGLASTLVRAVVEDVVGQGRRIVPVCPYVAAWLPKHPEYQSHVVSPDREHRRAVAAQRR